jgi:hypothetical protein
MLLDMPENEISVKKIARSLKWRAMLGQFIIPAAPEGLSVKAFLRNAPRNGEPFDSALRRKGMSVDLRVFRQGRLQYQESTFANVAYNEMQEISSASCPALDGDQSNLLVVARCSLPGGEGYFGQEHQLIYENSRTGAVGSLLYDQSPVLQPGARTSPIVVLAPKTWVGKSVNSYVAFASTNSGLEAGIQDRPLEITILNQQGGPVYAKRFSLLQNSTFLFDVRRAVSGRMEMSDLPIFLNVVAKGGAGLFAIMTFAVNEASGNFALEHSLPPDYYVSGDRQRVRTEALEFNRTNES